MVFNKMNKSVSTANFDFTTDHYHFINLANLMEHYFLEKDEDKIRFVVMLNKKMETKIEAYLSTDPKRMYTEMIAELMCEFNLNVLVISKLLTELCNIKRGETESNLGFIQRIQWLLYQLDKESSLITKKHKSEIRSLFERVANGAYLKGYHNLDAVGDDKIAWYLEQSELSLENETSVLSFNELDDEKQEKCRHWGNIYCPQCLLLRKGINNI